MSGVINVWCGQCLVWSMSGVVNVLFYTRCDQCLVWSMSYFAHGVVNVWCDQCLVWWMSGVINVWCGQCPILHTVWSMSGVINVWCGQCPILHKVWSMSGVINVWCDQCLVCSMSSVVNVLFYTRCDQCLVWSMSGVINVCVINVVQSYQPPLFWDTFLLLSCCHFLILMLLFTEDMPFKLQLSLLIFHFTISFQLSSLSYSFPNSSSPPSKSPSSLPIFGHTSLLIGKPTLSLRRAKKLD